MTDLLAARGQMAMSLAFHIIFAAIGIAMPLLMVIAEWRYLRTGREVYLDLAQRWSRGVAIIFAVGAVSGTVLSFELGLLWPEFMRHAGPVISMPFSLEGFAFFMEAIFLGIYLYGWKRVRPRVHLASGVLVLCSGMLSGIFVISANGWMNHPVGFDLIDGRFANVDPLAAMVNPMWLPQALHMTVAAFLAVGFGVAGIHAGMLLRRPGSEFHRRALTLSLWMGGVSAMVMPLTGDVLAKYVASTQPAKLAAMEGQFRTERGAPLRIGGLPDEDLAETRFAVEIPGALSFLAFGDFEAEVKGLEEFPREDWPPVLAVHLAFQLMVAIGLVLCGVVLLGAWLGWRGRIEEHRWFLWLLIFSGPLGFVGIETGWIVTEVGRQPWIIQGIMRTSEALSPMPHLIVPFAVFSVLYLVLAVVVIYLLARHVSQSPGDPRGG